MVADNTAYKYRKGRGMELVVRKITRGSADGLTLVELIVTVAILGILAIAAVPIVRFAGQT